MNNESSDVPWHLPTTDWDFRRISPYEVKLASVWEYARSSTIIRRDPQHWCGRLGKDTTLEWCIECSKGMFPAPWLLFRAKHSDFVEIACTGIGPPAFEIRELSWVKADLECLIDHAADLREAWSVLDRKLSDYSYELRVDFGRISTEEVIRKFERWLRRESRKHPRMKRGKASALPAEPLKWLAAWRLDNVRTPLTVSEVQKHLQRHRTRTRLKAPLDVLPVYASAGAWSNAKKRAAQLISLLESQPKEFEAELRLT